MKQKCIVVKIGSNTITGGSDGLDRELMTGIAHQVNELRELGWKVVIVSSGAVALGKPRMKNYDPEDILSKQRAAARGQPLLMAGWQDALRQYGLEADQLLFNKKNFEAHMRVLRAVDDGIVICNGDDTSNEPGVEKEIIYEDNDDLAADIAIALQADVLVYLTDVSGILDKIGNTVESVEPHENLFKKHIQLNGKNDKGIGGIASKHKYASVAAENGIKAVIVKGKDYDVLLRVVNGEAVGTSYTKR